MQSVRHYRSYLTWHKKALIVYHKLSLKEMSTIQGRARRYRQVRVQRNTGSEIRGRQMENEKLPTNQDSNAKTVSSLLVDSQSPPRDIKPEFPSDAEELEIRIKKNNYNRDQARHSFRPKVNPQETTLMLFPGQGSQFVGMGRKVLEYPNVAEMYDTASKILGYDLLDICLNGPKETLNKTIYCQPAVMVTSLAAVEKLKDEKPSAIENCVSAAGYSVGEYSALIFAGALSFEDGVRLVKVRAEAMQKASEMVSSRMMTVFLNADAKIRFACHAAKLYCSKELHIENAVCEVANFLFPGCKVVAGNTEALDFIEKNSKEFGIKRIQYLPVSGAFHTSLMLPAKEHLAKALSSTDIETPLIPVHSNVDSLQYRSSKVVSRLLAEQLHRPVRWEQTMHVLFSRQVGELFPYTYEVGPGRQLGSILKMVNARAFEQYRNVEV